MSPLLSLQSVAKRLGARDVVTAVDFEVGAGEFVGVVGPNGAGKTTLLKLMAKLLEPTGGAVWLDGDELAGLSRRALARQAAVVPQASATEFAFSALDVVLMGRHVHRRRFESETADDVRIAREAMAMTDTSALADRKVTELSGGERQRVILARALAQEPRLLLLDEPTANLDLRHQIEVLERVRALVRSTGLTAVAALHDLELASRFCGRLIMMSDGSIVADGAPADVLTPLRLREVFGVATDVKPDALTGGLTITVLNGASNGV